MRRSFFKTLLSLCLLFSLLLSHGVGVLSVEAAKKKKGGAGQEELQKDLEAMDKTITDLLGKAQARYLFSAKDSNQLIEIKYKLMDMMKDNATNPLLIRPVYQAAVLYSLREEFTDAYELFNFISANFPDSPYSARAKGDIQQLKKKLGENYFMDTSSTPSTTPPAGKK